MVSKKPYHKSFSNVKIFGTLNAPIADNHRWIKQIFSKFPDSFKTEILYITLDRLIGSRLQFTTVCANGLAVKKEFHYTKNKPLDKFEVLNYRATLIEQSRRVFAGIMQPRNWAVDDMPPHNGYYLNRPSHWETVVRYLKEPNHKTTLPLATWNDVFNTTRKDEYKFEILDAEFQIRDLYIERYAYPIITTELVDSLATICAGKRVIDVGAGSGYLAFQLQLRGIDIVAVDDDSFERKFTTPSSIELVRTNYLEIDYSDFDVVIVSWPDYESGDANKLLDKLSDKQTVLYCGEGVGGCTADMAFFNTLDAQFEVLKDETILLNSSTKPFKRIRDDWTAYYRTRGRHIVKRRGELYAIIGTTDDKTQVHKLDDNFQPIEGAIEEVLTADFDKPESFWDF